MLKNPPFPASPYVCMDLKIISENMPEIAGVQIFFIPGPGPGIFFALISGNGLQRKKD